uniref:Myb-like domain-containing protein n=1 Tax=Setaria viridis TaxID=4556 RepID=A0A4U6UZ10_SETVI|nr:hypothetical protein SEVIR_5G306300v2 [Setaria viridis]
MNRPESKKRQPKSHQAAGESAAVASIGGGAPVDGTFHVRGAASVSPIAGGAPRASGSLEAGGSPGADGIPTSRAPGTGGFPAFGTHAASPWWPPSFAVQPPPNNSEWVYSQGGFMNMLQSPMVPGMNYPNGSQQPQNYHLVGGIMSHSTTSPTSACSKETPSPTGSSADAAAQMGSQDKETIDVEDNDTIQPARSNVRSNARSNARSIATSIARSDRRLNWSNEEDIRLVSAWLHCSIDPVDGNDRKADQYWSDVTSTYSSTTKCDCMRNRNQLKLR